MDRAGGRGGLGADKDSRRARIAGTWHEVGRRRWRRVWRRVEQGGGEGEADGWARARKKISGSSLKFETKVFPG